jgi:hypothetical protein
MADVMATCGATANIHGHPAPPDQNQCYLSNHRPSRSFNGTVTLTTYEHFGESAPKVLLHKQMALPAGPGAIEWFGPAALPVGNDSSLISTVRDEDGAIVSEHMVQLVTPEHIRVPVAKVTFEIAEAANADGSINVSVASGKTVALWVTLTSMAEGRFSENAFFLPATVIKTIQFIPFTAATASAAAAATAEVEGTNLAVLKATLRVEDLSMYRSLAPAPPAPPSSNFVEAPADSTCSGAKAMPVSESDCGRACASLKFKYTGPRARANISGCFVMAAGPYAGNCNYNTNASATCTPPCTLMGTEVRSICELKPAAE